MSSVIWNAIDFFFTILAGASAYGCLAVLRNLQNQIRNLDAELATFKHPVSKIHKDLISLKNSNKRKGNKNG